MDKDSFWQEITDIAKHHKQRSHPVEQLPEEQMEQLESNVYAHIDQLFSDSKVAPETVNSDVITTADLTRNSSLKQANSLWTRLFQFRPAPVFVMAMIALCSVGVLSYLFSDNRLSEPLLDIPASVVAANVDRYIQIPQESSRALAETLPSERRRAFLTGVTQAGLDLIGDTKNPSAHQMALWYHHTTTNASSDDALDALKTVQLSVARYSANEQTNLWLKQGYAVELVHLAARRSMVDLNANALKDALQFYSIHALMPEPGKTEPTNPELKSSHADVAKQYIYNHEKLIDAAPAHLATPEQLQEIVDMTHDMKVLVQ